MNLKKKLASVAAALGMAATLTVAATPPAEAADRCHLYRQSQTTWVGGCENTGSRVVVRCVDGSRVKHVQSAFGRGSHIASCSWLGLPWGFYRAEAAWLRYY